MIISHGFTTLLFGAFLCLGHLTGLFSIEMGRFLLASQKTHGVPA